MQRLLVSICVCALAYKANAATTYNVSTALQLVNAVNANNADTSGGGGTINVAAGTYVLSTSLHAGGDPNVGLDITRPVTLQGVSGANPTISFSGNQFIGIRVQVNNTTVQGITLAGSRFGLKLEDVGSNSSTPGYIVNAIVRDVTISTTGNDGGAIAAGGLVDSLIERVTVTSTYLSGIVVGDSAYFPGRFPIRNLIINNSVSNTTAAHGIAIILGDYNVIANNTITDTGGFGVLVTGGQHNYIAQNTILHPSNGIVLTKEQGSGRQSNRNYVGNNSLTLAGKPGSDALWFDYDSNYNMGFLNEGSLSEEGGMSLFNSIGNIVRGNNLHDNPFGGIIMQKDPGSGPTIPAFNSIQQNYFHDHGANGGITINTDSQNDYGFNYISAPVGSNNRAGFVLNGSVGSRFYSNTLRDLTFGELIQNTSTGGTLYLNRHLNAINHFVQSGSNPQFDSGSGVLGGNYYTDFPSANGNPGTAAYINGNNGFNTGGGYWIDRYPYSSESLGKNYGINVRLPSSGSYLAAGSKKTISWSSQGCTNVNLNLVNSSGTVIQNIVTNAPDYGFYRWIVPSIAAGNYAVRADCLNSSYATVNKSSTGRLFTLTTADLLLLSPQANLISDYPSTMRISWYKSANVPSVDVYIRYSDSQAFQLLQAGVTVDYLSIATPQVTSNRVSVALVSGSYADSTDGWFTIRGASTGAFTAPSGVDNFYVGTPYLLEWVSPQNTDYVAIDLISGGVTKNIATQLADFGSYLMLVPDAPGNGAVVRLTFYSPTGTVIQQLSSTGGTVLYSSSQPNAVSVAAGSGQSAPVNTAFATPLQVQLTNAQGFGIQGVSVTFIAPTSGASGNFSGSLSTTVVTNSAGVATTSAFTANGVAGTYSVTAMADNLTTSFTLTNTAGVATTRIGAYAGGFALRDVNGDGINNNSDPYTLFVTPMANDIAVFGDWNGDGKTKIGVYRDGFWALDYNGNGMFDSADKFYGFGGASSAGYLPVVGDWSGSGTSKVGFYKSGFWALDFNGDGSYNSGDKFFGLGGNANEVPIVGDWNHDGKTKAGVFYPFNGYDRFLLDVVGNGFDASTKIYDFVTTMAGDKPVFGDWTGNGFTKIGVFRKGFWVIDYNGDGVYTNGTVDRFYGFSTGNISEVPLVGDWNGNGISKIGIYLRPGYWLLDYNGNGSFDGYVTDKFYGYNITSTDQPIIGKW